MRFLLTSMGITNASIQNALFELLGRPIAECSALVIPTAAYYFSQGPAIAYRLISGKGPGPLCELGWKSLGVLELTALPSVDRENWIPLVREVDALLVGGGDPMYLCDWMRQSGFAELLPSLRREVVYVGVSAGSMAVTPSFGETYNDRPTAGYRGLALVDFALGVHLDHPSMPDNSLAKVEAWAAGVPVRTYGIDDETAIKVVDGKVKVISEGHWKLFPPKR
ncbi:MAG: peptidase E [Chloroflexi bacterium]|nr:MAG: peptidase E [Chloroflexota bacterium]